MWYDLGIILTIYKSKMIIKKKINLIHKFNNKNVSYLQIEMFSGKQILPQHFYTNLVSAQTFSNSLH